MAAQKRDSETGRGLRCIHRMESYFGVEPLPSHGHVLRSMNGAGNRRQARAFFRNRCEAFLIAAGLAHPAHGAVMLAVPATAGGKACIGVPGEQRRDQHPAEDHQQRMCNRSAHGFTANLAQTENKVFDRDHGQRPFSTPEESWWAEEPVPMNFRCRRPPCFPGLDGGRFFMSFVQLGNAVSAAPALAQAQDCGCRV